MLTLTREQIVRQAFVKGGSATWVDFLKSNEVAERIATDVRLHLQASGIDISYHGGPKRLVVVRPAVRWVGTFAVEVKLPGVRTHLPGYEYVNETNSNKAFAALQACVKSADLVTSWTSGPRR